VGAWLLPGPRRAGVSPSVRRDSRQPSTCQSAIWSPTGAGARLTEAIEQQTATSEILRVILSSPTDTQPVFDTIAANAARLCSANDAQVLRVEGELLRLVAAFGAPSMPSVRRLTRGHLVGRAVIESRARTRCLLRGLRDLG